MDMKEKREMRLQFAACAVGGFFGGYAIFNHCDVFGNAQTANLIHIVCKIFSGDLEGLVFLLIALATYIAGNVFFVIGKRFFRIDMRVISFVASAAAIVAIGVMPGLSNDYLALLPIMFVTPIQWNAFNCCCGYVSSTIFSTNNLRQATVSFASYVIDRDKEQLKKTKFYWSVILSFHIGVAASCVASVFLGLNSIWFCFVFLALAVGMYLIAEEVKPVKQGRFKNL